MSIRTKIDRFRKQVRARTGGMRRRAHGPSLEWLEPRRLLAASVSEFPLRAEGAPAEYITAGTNGTLWATLSTNNVARLNPTTGEVDQYPIPSPNSAPGSIVKATDGDLWFIEAAYDQFGVVDPSTGVVTEVPVLPGIKPGLQDLAVGPDGNLWFTEARTNKIGEIDPTTFAVQEYAVPTADSEPYGIATGSDGNLWFTESGANKVGRINPTTHAISDFTIATSGNAQPEGIATGSDGNLWFTEPGADAIGMINPYTPKTVSTYTKGLGANASPARITEGSDGNLWFTEPGASEIGTISPTGTIKQYGDYTFRGMSLGIASGGDGNLYFAEANADELSSVTTSGVFKTFKVTTTSAGTPTSIAADQVGDLWFAIPGSYEVGVVNPSNDDSVEYAVPTGDYEPQQIALDPADGTLWFTEYDRFGNDSKIGKINPTTRTVTDVSAIPNANAEPRGITFNAKTADFWITEPGANTIGRVNPSTGAVADNILPTLPSGARPYGIVADSTGKLWFTEEGTGQVAVYDPAADTIKQVGLATNSSPEGITLGPDGNIWFVEAGGGGFSSSAAKIGVINPSTDQLIHEYLAAATGSIATGPDGALWFTESGSIGRIDTLGHITTFATANETPQGVATGPDGNLWFTGSGNYLGGFGASNYPNVTGTVDLAPVATATQLSVATQPPADVTASKGFGLVVSMEDALGGTDTYYDGPVTIALGQNPGNSTLGGTLTSTAVDGVASFPGLTLDRAGAGYTIVASSPGVTPVASGPIAVSLAATQLVITAQPPGDVPAGSTFTVTVAAEDPYGNVDTSFNGTLAVALGNNPGMSTLGGPTTLGADDGVASFSGLSLNNVGNGYTLLLTDLTSQLQAVGSAGFNVTPQPATHLVVTTQPPAGVVAGASFGLTISAENDLGQVDTADSSPVSLSLAIGTSATLGGPVAANLVDGVATFSGLTIDVDGPGYKIVASSGGLASATTNAISVISASASRITLTPLVAAAITGVAFPAKVAVLDPFGNVASSYTGTVHFTSGDPKFVPPRDYTFNPSDDGSHVFQLTLSTLGSQTITVADDANSSIAATAAIPVDPPTATKTTLTASPSSSAYGQPVSLQATVTQAVNGTVTFLDGSTVLGASTVAKGIATFGDAVLPPGTHTLTARYGGSLDGSLASSTSAPFALKVSLAATGASVTASTTSAILGRSVELTALVFSAAPGSSKVPTGTVSFLDGTTVIGTSRLDATGHATYSTAKLGLGTHSITVSYSGDSDDSAGASHAIQVYVGDLPKSDFDGDGKADLAVYGKNPTTGRYGFEILTSSTGFSQAKAITFDNKGYGFGGAQSIPVPGDYFGDGKDAYALWSPSGGGGMTFTAISSVTSKSITVNFGGINDLPVVADVDGDGKADFGVYGYQAGYGYRFAFLLSSDNFNPNTPLVFNNHGYGYGNAQSIPVVADFDGSGKAGFGLYNPSPNGSTFTYVSSSGGSFTRTIGSQYDVPMTADVDGDGKADLVLYGPDPAKAGHYRYEVLTSTSGDDPAKAIVFNNNGYGYGGPASVPVAADYEGDGKADFALFNPDTAGGMEYVYQASQTGAGVVVDFATSTDISLTSPTYLRARKVRGH